MDESGSFSALDAVFALSWAAAGIRACSGQQGFFCTTRKQWHEMSDLFLRIKVLESAAVVSLDQRDPRNLKFCTHRIHLCSTTTIWKIPMSLVDLISVLNRCTASNLSLLPRATVIDSSFIVRDAPNLLLTASAHRGPKIHKLDSQKRLSFLIFIRTKSIQSACCLGEWSFVESPEPVWPGWPRQDDSYWYGEAGVSHARGPAPGR